MMQDHTEHLEMSEKWKQNVDVFILHPGGITYNLIIFAHLTTEPGTDDKLNTKHGVSHTGGFMSYGTLSQLISFTDNP